MIIIIKDDSITESAARLFGNLLHRNMYMGLKSVYITMAPKKDVIKSLRLNIIMEPRRMSTMSTNVFLCL